MKAVVQRVKRADLSVDGKNISSIGYGLVVFFCAEQKDIDDVDKKNRLSCQKDSKSSYF